MKKRHKGLSIKARVTLWYTFFMILVFGITAVYLVSSSQRMSGRQMRERLVDTVTDAVSQVRFRYGELDAEELDFYKNGVSVFLYDTQGRLLAPKVTRGIQVDSLLEDQTIKTASSGRERWMIYDVYSEGEDAGFWVRGMISMTEYGQALGNLPILFGSALPLLAVLAALGGFRITRRAFRPVTQMAETARAIGTGSDLSQRIETDGRGDELNQLGDTMNEMLARLQASFEAERQFSSDVSHELRTPIAVIRSQCEFALSGQAGEEEKREAFEAVLKQSERMNSIVSQLLLLSRAENGKFVPEREPVELNVLCETVCEELEAMAAERQVKLAWNTEELQITGDETLLIRMVNNLVSNAIRYNREGGHVLVEVCEEDVPAGEGPSGEGGVRIGIIRVNDTGAGIPADKLEKIFERFYRLEKSRSKELGGTGLGLAIVKHAALYHGGEVFVESEEDVGTRFTVRLPIG